MQLSQFSYDLPNELIAQTPLKKRDEALLMIVDRKNQTIKHDVFSSLDQHIPTNSTFVYNDTKVIPARLLTEREGSGGKAEILLLKALDDGYSYQVMLRPTKRLKNREKLTFDNGKLVAEIIDKEKGVVRFNKKNIKSSLERSGHIPLPPYISRSDTAMDRTYYQTIFAKNEGSIAAPTAGLHFTKSLRNQLTKKGHSFVPVTLQINYGTFKAVETEDIRDHDMHTEEFIVTRSNYKIIETSKQKKRPVIAVGTTSCRVLETVAKCDTLHGITNIFIYPGYTFKAIDILITNFHLPKSTLLMLVYAFGGDKLIKQAYQEAIKNKYRFFSYGDAMLIV